MRAFVSCPSKAKRTGLTGETGDASVQPTEESCSPGDMLDVFTGYLSDLSDNSDTESDSEPSSDPDSGLDNHIDSVCRPPQSSVPVSFESGSIPAFPMQAPPPLKRQRLDVSSRKARVVRCELIRKNQEDALKAIRLALKSRRELKFQAGANGLQAYRARAIQACLTMVVEKRYALIAASEVAAEGNGFARKWGGRLVRTWVREWITNRKLPASARGTHIKSFSLLSDPGILAEMRSYVRSNRWAMNPQKLADFSARKMVPKIAKQYLQNIVTTEIPLGLKKYLELELFPRIHLRPASGISLRTARRWLHRQGFRYTEHRKALYFDGHERPDVVQYRQDIFLPTMAEYRSRIIEYVIGDVEREVHKAQNYVEHRIVVACHDETTAQANDGEKKSWVFEDEYPLKKKGQGRGIHQSEVICSTCGWLKEASQTLEYGKNYEGYWNGEMFVKQVSNCGYVTVSFN